MPVIGDIVRVKSLKEICKIHNVSDISKLAQYGPGWDSTYMDNLCDNTYEIFATDPKPQGTRYGIKDSEDCEWWLIEEWFDVEENTKPMSINKHYACRHHDQPTGIVLQNVMLLDKEPQDMWSQNTEDKLVTEALENAGRQLKYRLRSWPICGNGGEVDLWGYLDREAKTVTAHWCCSCQNNAQ